MVLHHLEDLLREIITAISLIVKSRYELTMLSLKGESSLL
jgi:hypothetical protein